MTAPALTARLVVTHDDGSVLALAFAEHSDGGGAQLLVQRAHHFDEQDRQLGQDTYCLSTETGACVYGGIVRLEVGDRSVTVELDDTVATTLAYPKQFELRVPDREHWRLTAQVLPALLG